MKEGMKEWALLYAGLGFAVFPLRQRDKRPATEIANQGGVSQQAVSNALNGKRVGKVKVIPAICKALGFKAKDIVIIED